MLANDVNARNHWICSWRQQTLGVVDWGIGTLKIVGSTVARKGRVGLAVALLAASGAGCATVAPYERETLSRADMELDRDEALGRAEGHATEVREGASGGLGAGGGGCGCN
jgi:hypothetical protein